MFSTFMDSSFHISCQSYIYKLDLSSNICVSVKYTCDTLYKIPDKVNSFLNIKYRILKKQYMMKKATENVRGVNYITRN